jgi:hypothetical protein
MPATTIKVPVELRDRLAEHARRDHLPLAAVIARALDAAEEGEFWDAVGVENAALSDSERADFAANPALLENLADPLDDEISARNEW